MDRRREWHSCHSAGLPQARTYSEEMHMPYKSINLPLFLGPCMHDIFVLGAGTIRSSGRSGSTGSLVRTSWHTMRTGAQGPLA